MTCIVISAVVSGFEAVRSAPHDHSHNLALERGVARERLRRISSRSMSGLKMG